MGVKTIFKVLIGTIAAIVLSFLTIELFNISVASYQLKYVSKMAAKQACELFTSETYKSGKSRGDTVVGGSYALNDVVDTNGDLYVTGDFYGCGAPDNGYAKRVWTKIYANQQFINFCTSRTVNGSSMDKYFATKALKIAAESAMTNSNINVPELEWDATPREVYNQTLLATADVYKKNLYTTTNLGIPYMDYEIVTKMFQWNLSQLLSNCNPDLIKPDDNGEICINFKGFKVYADQSKINNYEYKIYDLSPDPRNSDRASNATELWNDLNINANVEGSPDYLGWMGSDTGIVGHETQIGDQIVYDDWYITSVGVRYNIVVNYEGITPLRRLVAFVFDSQVAGLGGTEDSYSGDRGSTWSNVDRNGFTSGGLTGDNDNGLVTTGKLTYVLSR